LFIHITLACVHKGFTLTGRLKSDKCETAWNTWIKQSLAVEIKTICSS